MLYSVHYIKQNLTWIVKKEKNLDDKNDCIESNFTWSSQNLLFIIYYEYFSCFYVTFLNSINEVSTI